MEITELQPNKNISIKSTSEPPPCSVRRQLYVGLCRGRDPGYHHNRLLAGRVLQAGSSDRDAHGQKTVGN